MDNEDFKTEDFKPAGFVPGSIESLLDEFVDSLGDGSKDVLGIRTGLIPLDRALKGLSGLTLLAGVGGLGKSSLALQIAYDVVHGERLPVLIYSLEMSKTAVMAKLLSRLSHWSYSDILLKGGLVLNHSKSEDNIAARQKLDTEVIRDLNWGFDWLKQVSSQLYIRDYTDKDSSGKTVEISLKTLEQEIELLKAQTKSEKVLVIIDHLQVFPVEDKAKSTVEQESYLIQQFKAVMEHTQCPFLVVSQKNKQGYYSSGLESVKGSSNLAYLADQVLFLEEPMKKKKKKGTKSDEVEDDDDDIPIHPYGIKPINLVVKKNRYGPPCVIKLVFEGRYGIFYEAEGVNLDGQKTYKPGSKDQDNLLKEEPDDSRS